MGRGTKGPLGHLWVQAWTDNDYLNLRALSRALFDIISSSGHSPEELFLRSGNSPAFVCPSNCPPVNISCYHISSKTTGPKIKFYLFAIVYLPTLLLPTQLFFCFSRSIVFFFSIFQFQSEILTLYKLTIKKTHRKSFYPSLFVFVSFVMAALFIYTNLRKKKKKKKTPTYPPLKHLSRQLQTNNFLSMALVGFFLTWSEWIPSVSICSSTKKNSGPSTNMAAVGHL